MDLEKRVKDQELQISILVEENNELKNIIAKYDSAFTDLNVKIDRLLKEIEGVKDDDK